MQQTPCGGSFVSKEISNKERAKKILDNLTDEYGDEVFTSDGYAYYDDALKAFTDLVDQAEARGIERAAVIAEGNKMPLAKALAVTIRAANKENHIKGIEAEEGDTK